MPLPFLRTPPFPHTNRRRVAISRIVRDGAGRVDEARAERLFAMIRDARIGGAFWDPVRDPWLAVEAAPGDDERVAAAAIGGIPMRVTKAGAFGTPATGPDRMASARHVLIATRYRNPFDGRAIQAEDAIAFLIEWRRLIDENRSIGAAVDMAWWKRREIRTFLWSGGDRPRFVRRAATACRIVRSDGKTVAAWPSRMSPALSRCAAAQGTAIVRVEDGFIRSVGLGAALHPPYSVTVDPIGIHYDPAAPSALEVLLQNAVFPPPLLARAAALRETIVDRGIGKYGGRGGADLPVRQAGRRLVVVTGQVSDDQSVLLGG